jgi:hypothetical protein
MRSRMPTSIIATDPPRRSAGPRLTMRTHGSRAAAFETTPKEVEPFMSAGSSFTIQGATSYRVSGPKWLHERGDDKGDLNELITNPVRRVGGALSKTLSRTSFQIFLGI